MDRTERRARLTGCYTTIPTMFKDEPRHDWSSHLADAFRYLCWNMKLQKLDFGDGKFQDVAEDTFSYI